MTAKLSARRPSSYQRPRPRVAAPASPCETPTLMLESQASAGVPVQHQREGTTPRHATSLGKGTVMHAHEALIRERYQALADRDLGKLAGLLTDDVKWRVPGSNPLAGEYHGRAEVVGFFRRLIDLTGGTSHVEPLAIFADESWGVAVEGGSAAGFADRHVTVYRFRGHRIAEASFHPGDQYTLDRYWRKRS